MRPRRCRSAVGEGLPPAPLCLTPQPRDDLEEEVANEPRDPSRQLTHCFLRLVNLDNGVFDRLSRYEATLAGQTTEPISSPSPRYGAKAWLARSAKRLWT